MKDKTNIINFTSKAPFFKKLFFIWGIPIIIVSSFGILAAQPDLRLEIPTLIAVTAIVSMLLAVILYSGERELTGWSPATIMAVAAVLRLLFLFRQPELSDDIYRYLWDGLNTLSGHNPYALAPAESRASEAALLSLVNHSELVTIYPPAAQLVFAAGAFPGAGVLGVKLLLTAMDLITCALILKLLSALRMPSWRAVLYAWNPLPVLEISASGHIDGAAIMFFFSSLLLLLSKPDSYFSKPRRSFVIIPALSFFSGLLFSCAGLAKLLPVIFLPGCILLAYQGSLANFLLGVIIGVAGLSLPFLPDLQKAFPTLRTYIHNWEFASFSFRNLRYITGSGDTARRLLAGFFAVFTSLLYMNLWRGFRKGSGNLESIGSTTLLVLRTFYCIAALFLFLTPTLHPWYALYLVCLLPFAAGPTGLIFSWSVFLAYRVLISYTLNGHWVEDDYIPAIISLAPASAFLLSNFIRRQI